MMWTRHTQDAVYITGWGGKVSCYRRTRADVRKDHVSTAGTIAILFEPNPNPDSLNASKSLVALAEADTYTFAWALGLSSNTVNAVYQGFHTTTPSLTYTSGYTETIADSDRPQLITFTSADSTVIQVSSTGQLQPLQNSPSLAATDLSAQFCDGSSVGPVAVYSNMQTGSPKHYQDLN